MKRILIVGAGPTGLTCAIELARQKHHVTIIEQKATREHISKAIGINPQSLKLLEASDVTPRLLAAGLQIKQMRMHYEEKELSINLANLPQPYNFMLSLPQDQTEAILETRLNELGVRVQRETSLVLLTQQVGAVNVHLEHAGQRQQQQYDMVIGADGAHSTVRKQLDIPFQGKTYPEQWSLADVRMEWSYDNTAGHGFIAGPGHVGVVIPMIDDCYRIVSNHPKPFSILPRPYMIRETLWRSDFTIGCRIADTYQKDNVFLAGDAAHIHTPVGGRGMNLGIEDACILAKLIVENKQETYTSLRRPVGKKIVKGTDMVYGWLNANNPARIWLRDQCIFPLLKTKWIQTHVLCRLLSGSTAGTS